MKKWKKYFSFSTLKSKDFIILYSILMIGLLVRDYDPYADYFKDHVQVYDWLYNYRDIGRLDNSLEETKK